jgi:hypothetical protein
MAFTYYVKVESVQSDQLIVADLDNNNSVIQITGRDLIERSFSADQYSEEEKISKTRAAELLVSSHNRPLSVSFMKTDGTERVIRGRLVRPEPLLGRSMVEDLDKTGKDRLRQVDHRTINWLIVDGVKYYVK